MLPSRRSPGLLAFALVLLLAAGLSPAAISVSGVANRTNHTGSASFTVADPGGFTTTATLNGNAVAVGSAVAVTGAGFYELVVSETPTGGGASTVQTVLFVIRAPGRGSTETGLPAFTAVPPVDDAPSAVNTGVLVLTAPSSYPDELALPVVALLRKSDGDPLWLNTPVRAEAFPDHPIQLRRGFGYTLLPPQTGAGSVAYDGKTAGLAATADIAVETGTDWTPASGTLSADTDWGTNARIHVTGDLTVAAAATLTIGEGTVVKLASGADLNINGSLDITGTAAHPVVFAPATAGSAWGGFFLQQPTSAVVATGAIFFGSGADQTWFDTHAGYASHRPEQALFLVGPAGASLTLTDCALIENTGQILHNAEGGAIALTRCLLQGATTSGELTGGTLDIDRSALLLFPNADPTFVDADNDGIYLTSGQHSLTRTVIGYTKDDGIDTGGSPGGYTTNTTVQFCWFESILHEGMSNSGAKNCYALDSVFFNCGQTIESGYDGPKSFLLRCLTTANMVGARMGDNYDWNYTNNHLTVTDSLLLYNLYHDIWGYDWASWTYNSSKMTVSGNHITSPEDLARHPGNTAYDPAAHASLIAPFMPVPGSNVGVAITSATGQQPLDAYAPTFRVQLSTFSSHPVSVPYSVSGKVHPDDAEAAAIATGTLVFDPGQTRKELPLPLPGSPDFALVRVALGSPVNAEVTGGEAWYFRDAGVPAESILIPRSSAGWLYDAQRAEPSVGWEGLDYNDSAWKPATTEFGFGEGDEATVPTAAEQGPGSDRTRAFYFRRAFTLADPASVTGLRLELNRDDGAVVYLNGTEIGRSNLAAGPILYSTLASNADPENVFIPLAVAPAHLALLQTGPNILAVELHQSSATSSDLGFDLELSATLSAPASDATGLTAFDGHAYLYWLEDDGTLEESDDLNAWDPNPAATSPHRLPIDASRRFFRIRTPLP